MSNNDKPGHPDCHECGGTGTNAASLPCSVCHHGANLAARRQGSKYAAFAAHMAEGPPLETGALAVGSLSQPSPYSTAAVEATVDHRIRELEADRDAFRDSALAAESILRQGSDALARILGRDEGLPLALHLPTVRLIVAGLQEAQCERDDLRDAARSVVDLCERADDEDGLQQCDCGVRDRVTGSDRWRRLRSLTLPNPHLCTGLACPCSHPTYAEVSAELTKAERQRDALADAAREVVDVCVNKGDEDGLFCCDCGAKDLAESSAWRRLCALVKP